MCATMSSTSMTEHSPIPIPTGAAASTPTSVLEGKRMDRYGTLVAVHQPSSDMARIEPKTRSSISGPGSMQLANSTCRKANTVLGLDSINTILLVLVDGLVSGVSQRFKEWLLANTGHQDNQLQAHVQAKILFRMELLPVCWTDHEDILQLQYADIKTAQEAFLELHRCLIQAVPLSEWNVFRVMTTRAIAQHFLWQKDNGIDGSRIRCIILPPLEETHPPSVDVAVFGASSRNAVLSLLWTNQIEVCCIKEQESLLNLLPFRSGLPALIACMKDAAHYARKNSGVADRARCNSRLEQQLSSDVRGTTSELLQGQRTSDQETSSKKHLARGTFDGNQTDAIAAQPPEWNIALMLPGPSFSSVLPKDLDLLHKNTNGNHQAFSILSKAAVSAKGPNNDNGSTQNQDLLVTGSAKMEEIPQPALSADISASGDTSIVEPGKTIVLAEPFVQKGALEVTKDATGTTGPVNLLESLQGSVGVAAVVARPGTLPGEQDTVSSVSAYNKGPPVASKYLGSSGGFMKAMDVEASGGVGPLEEDDATQNRQQMFGHKWTGSGCPVPPASQKALSSVSPDRAGSGEDVLPKLPETQRRTQLNPTAPAFRPRSSVLLGSQTNDSSSVHLATDWSHNCLGSSRSPHNTAELRREEQSVRPPHIKRDTNKPISSVSGIDGFVHHKGDSSVVEDALSRDHSTQGSFEETHAQALRIAKTLLVRLVGYVTGYRADLQATKTLFVHQIPSEWSKAYGSAYDLGTVMSRCRCYNLQAFIAGECNQYLVLEQDTVRMRPGVTLPAMPSSINASTAMHGASQGTEWDQTSVVLSPVHHSKTPTNDSSSDRHLPLNSSDAYFLNHSAVCSTNGSWGQSRYEITSHGADSDLRSSSIATRMDAQGAVANTPNNSGSLMASGDVPSSPTMTKAMLRSMLYVLIASGCSLQAERWENAHDLVELEESQVVIAMDLKDGHDSDKEVSLLSANLDSLARRKQKKHEKREKKKLRKALLREFEEQQRSRQTTSLPTGDVEKMEPVLKMINSMSPEDLQLKRQQHRNDNIGILVSAIKTEWARKYEGCHSLSVYMNVFGFRKLKFLLQEIPNIRTVGFEGHMRVCTVDHFEKYYRQTSGSPCVDLSLAQSVPLAASPSSSMASTVQSASNATVSLRDMPLAAFPSFASRTSAEEDELFARLVFLKNILVAVVRRTCEEQRALFRLAALEARYVSLEAIANEVFPGRVVETPLCEMELLQFNQHHVEHIRQKEQIIPEDVWGLPLTRIKGAMLSVYANLSCDNGCHGVPWMSLIDFAILCGEIAVTGSVSSLQLVVPLPTRNQLLPFSVPRTTQNEVASLQTQSPLRDVRAGKVHADSGFAAPELSSSDPMRHRQGNPFSLLQQGALPSFPSTGTGFLSPISSSSQPLAATSQASATPQLSPCTQMDDAASVLQSLVSHVVSSPTESSPLARDILGILLAARTEDDTRNASPVAPLTTAALATPTGANAQASQTLLQQLIGTSSTNLDHASNDIDNQSISTACPSLPLSSIPDILGVSGIQSSTQSRPEQRHLKEAQKGPKPTLDEFFSAHLGTTRTPTINTTSCTTTMGSRSSFGRECQVPFL